MRNSRRGLAAGVNFIWDLPMIPLLKFSNIHRHRGRETSLSKPPQFNSIRVCSDFDALRSAAGQRLRGRTPHRCCPTTKSINLKALGVVWFARAWALAESSTNQQLHQPHTV